MKTSLTEKLPTTLVLLKITSKGQIKGHELQNYVIYPELPKLWKKSAKDGGSLPSASYGASLMKMALPKSCAHD